jgi:tetratricopeptide (TPR) repeat protein
MPYDLFISYSRRDDQDGRVTELVDRIRTDFPRYANRELTAFFDRHSIQGMEDWRQNIYQGLRESRLFLTCLSPAYIESNYCEWEFIEYQKREIATAHGAEGVAPIYFVQVPGWDDKDFDQRCKEWVADLRRRQHFDLRPWSAEGEAALKEAAVREHMEALNQRLAQTIQQGEQAEKCLGNVDAHNPHFQGRSASLRELRDNFVKPETIGVLTAVNGVGGLGKTALAIEYAHAYAHEYGGGRWQVRCAGHQNLGLALAQLATPIGFEFTDDEKKSADLMLDRVRAELKRLAEANQPHRCLLILDNVDRPELLSPAMVQRLNCGDWLHVVATSRLGENELSGRSPDRRFVAIDELPPADALALIEEFQPNGAFESEAECAAARGIVTLLGGFTLAVEAAAVYLGKYAGEITCASFLALLKRKGLEELDRQTVASGEQVRHGEISLSATLAPTLERLKPAERLAMEFAALLPPDQAPLPWLRALVAESFPEMGQDSEPGLPDSWLNVVRSLTSQRLLQSTGLVDDEGRPGVVRVHRLVQELIKKTDSQNVKIRHHALVALSFERSEFLEEHWHEPDHQWEIGLLLAYADQLLDDRDPEAPRLVKWTSQWLGIGNSSKRHEVLLRRALSQLQADKDAEPGEIAILMSNLGLILISQAQLPESEALLREALAIDERDRDRDHPFIAIRLTNLGLVLWRMNRLIEAESLFRRSLEIAERNHDEEHPDLGIPLGNLARLLRSAGKPTEAEPLIRRAQAIHERNFGPNHPYIATGLGILAGVLMDTNRLEEAEPLCRRALAIDEKCYGPDHPDVATDLNRLARLLQTTKRLEEAESLYRRALAIREKALVPDHPDIFKNMEWLAGLLEATGRFEEAAPLRRRILEGQECKLGPDHPDMLRSWNNFSATLREKGLFGQAEPIDHRVLATTAKALGAAHPLTLHRCNNLVLTLILLGKLAEARELLRENWERKAEHFANTTPRIAFLACVVSLLEPRAKTPFLGQLKTFLAGPELPVTSDVSVPWDVAYFVEHLRPLLPSGSAGFLIALVAAMNDRANLPALDSFPEWLNQPPIPLDAPWPSE